MPSPASKVCTCSSLTPLLRQAAVRTNSSCLSDDEEVCEEHGAAHRSICQHYAMLFIEEGLGHSDSTEELWSAALPGDEDGCTAQGSAEGEGTISLPTGRIAVNPLHNLRLHLAERSYVGALIFNPGAFILPAVQHGHALEAGRQH